MRIRVAEGQGGWSCALGRARRLVLSAARAEAPHVNDKSLELRPLEDPQQTLNLINF